jgi:hypothetical protein
MASQTEKLLGSGTGTLLQYYKDQGKLCKTSQVGNLHILTTSGTGLANTFIVRKISKGNRIPVCGK